MDGSTRRQFLIASGMAGMIGTAGCLRLTGDAEPEATATDDTAPTENTMAPTDDAISQASESAPEDYEVAKFYMDHFDDGELRNTDAVDVRPASGSTSRVEIPGTFDGEANIMSQQACSRYSFDLIEDGSVIASSDEQILIYGYQYVFQQSATSAFITHHPSVAPEWDRTIRLSYPQGEYTITPDIRPDDGVFEFDFAAADIESGRYEWLLELSPPNSYTIEIGTFNDTLISVDPGDESSYPSSSQALEEAGSISNSSAQSVTTPQDTSGRGLRISSSGHGGGSSGDTAGRFITRDVSIECSSPYGFGAGTNRQFRTNNLTTGSSLTFDPE